MWYSRACRYKTSRQSTFQFNSILCSQLNLNVTYKGNFSFNRYLRPYIIIFIQRLENIKYHYINLFSEKHCFTSAD
jgi:hypothetical protein